MSAAAARVGLLLADFYRLVRRHPFLAMLGAVLYVAGLGLLAPTAAWAAEEPGPTPAGFGDLFQGPELYAGPLEGSTLYERYPMTSYFFDTNRLGPNDAVHVVINGIASAVMFLTVAVVRGAIVLTWWMFDFGSTNQLAESVSGSIGAVATSLLGWLLPCALAIGGLVAYSQTRGTQAGGMSQILWVFSGALLAISFALSPSLWVNTLTDVRTVASTGLMSATADSVAASKQPFEYNTTQYDESKPSDTMLRKSGDAIWRTYVVTPWCIGEFGSAEACSRYGKGLLDVGTNADDRSQWIENSTEGHPNEYDSDAAFYRWTAGKNSFDRLAISIVSFLVSIIFSALIITVSATATMAFIGAILLLFAGVIFTMLWCIPGRPRQWGNNWLETLLGLVIQSVLGTLMVGATLVLTAKAFQIAGTSGWGLGAGLSILVAVAAFSMKRTLGTIMQALTPGRGMTSMIGAMAVRSTTRLFTRATSRMIGGTARGAGKAMGATARGAGKVGGAALRRLPAAGPDTIPAGHAPATARDTGNARRWRPVVPPSRRDATRSPRIAGDRRRPGTSTAPQNREETRTSRGGRTTGVGTPRLRNNPQTTRDARTATPRSTPRTERPGPQRTARPSPRTDGRLQPRRDPLARHPRMEPRQTRSTTGGKK